jgi:RNA polymerase sigma-70 factor (ECF subfamily)
MGTAMMKDSDDTIPLLRQGAAGDQQALGELWDRYRERLKRMVRLRLDRRLQGRLDPSDVLQEAFLDFARRAGDFAESPEVSFFLWLRTLTGQRLQMLHRQHLGAKMRDAAREISLHRGPMPQATSVSLAAQLLGQFTSASARVARAEMQVQLQEALNSLDPIDREILALRHFEELSNAETAEVLGIDPSAASSRHVRALRRLRQVLQSIPGFFDGNR